MACSQWKRPFSEVRDIQITSSRHGIVLLMFRSRRPVYISREFGKRAVSNFVRFTIFTPAFLRVRVRMEGSRNSSFLCFETAFMGLGEPIRTAY